MTPPEQLKFDFMRNDERRAILDRALSSIDFEEYEWQRRRYDRMAA